VAFPSNPTEKKKSSSKYRSRLNGQGVGHGDETVQATKLAAPTLMSIEIRLDKIKVIG